MSGLISQGNSQSVSAGTVVKVMTFPNCNTSTFDITNANTSAFSYVGVFRSNAAAYAMNHPTAGSAIGGQAMVIPPGQSKVIAGNFKANINDAVYVAAITTTSNGQIVVATPVTSN